MLPGEQKKVLHVLILVPAELHQHGISEDINKSQALFFGEHVRDYLCVVVAELLRLEKFKNQCRCLIQTLSGGVWQ
jgi:hypothetical protein